MKKNPPPDLPETFETVCQLSVKPIETKGFLSWFNLHHFGDTEVNKLVRGKLVPKYPKKETPELKEKIYDIHATHLIPMLVTLNNDGEVIDARMKH